MGRTDRPKHVQCHSKIHKFDTAVRLVDFTIEIYESIFHSFICLFIYLFIRYNLPQCVCKYCGIVFIYVFLCFCFQIHIPLLHQYWCSGCNGVPNIIKYRIWTEKNILLNTVQVCLVLPSHLAASCGTSRPAVCLSDWLARRYTATIYWLLREKLQ